MRNSRPMASAIETIRETREPPCASAQRARAIAQCDWQLERITKLAREFDVDELFDISCEFLANALPLARARATISLPSGTRELSWRSRDATLQERRLARLTTSTNAGVVTSLCLEITERRHEADCEIVDRFARHLALCFSRARSASPDWRTSHS